MRQRGHFEVLEDRQLLAGDVVVSVVRGELMLQGDTLDNKVVIVAGAEANSFVIKGLDGTTVRKQDDPAATEVTVAGVKSIRADLGEGNDLIALLGGDIRGNVSIRTGAGGDRVLIGTIDNAPELAGTLPAGVNVGGSVLIGTDGGADQVAIDVAEIQGAISVNTGDENDVVSVGSTLETDAPARVQARAGIYMGLGAGDDSLSMNQVSARGAIAANGGSGDNTINVNDATSFVFGVYSDSGVDLVTLENVRAQLGGVYTGGGSDHVEIRDSVFTSIGVALGEGDDVLSIQNLKARHALFAGGVGQDIFEDLGGNDLALKIIRQFEIPADVNTAPLPRRVGLRSLFNLL